MATVTGGSIAEMSLEESLSAADAFLNPVLTRGKWFHRPFSSKAENVSDLLRKPCASTG